MGEGKKPHGRPVEKKVEPISENFENVIKSLVAPRKGEGDSSSKESKA